MAGALEDGILFGGEAAARRRFKEAVARGDQETAAKLFDQFSASEFSNATDPLGGPRDAEDSSRPPLREESASIIEGAYERRGKPRGESLGQYVGTQAAAMEKAGKQGKARVLRDYLAQKQAGGLGETAEASGAALEAAARENLSPGTSFGLGRKAASSSGNQLRNLEVGQAEQQAARAGRAAPTFQPVTTVAMERQKDLLDAAGMDTEGLTAGQVAEQFATQFGQQVTTDEAAEAAASTLWQQAARRTADETETGYIDFPDTESARSYTKAQKATVHAEQVRQMDEEAGLHKVFNLASRIGQQVTLGIWNPKNRLNPEDRAQHDAAVGELVKDSPWLPLATEFAAGVAALPSYRALGAVMNGGLQLARVPANIAPLVSGPLTFGAVSALGYEEDPNNPDFTRLDALAQGLATGAIMQPLSMLLGAVTTKLPGPVSEAVSSGGGYLLADFFMRGGDMSSTQAVESFLLGLGGQPGGGERTPVQAARDARLAAARGVFLDGLGRAGLLKHDAKTGQPFLDLSGTRLTVDEGGVAQTEDLASVRSPAPQAGEGEIPPAAPGAIQEARTTAYGEALADPRAARGTPPEPAPSLSRPQPGAVPRNLPRAGPASGEAPGRPSSEAAKGDVRRWVADLPEGAIIQTDDGPVRVRHLEGGQALELQKPDGSWTILDRQGTFGGKQEGLKPYTLDRVGRGALLGPDGQRQQPPGMDAHQPQAPAAPRRLLGPGRAPEGSKGKAAAPTPPAPRRALRSPTQEARHAPGRKAQIDREARQRQRRLSGEKELRNLKDVRFSDTRTGLHNQDAYEAMRARWPKGESGEPKLPEGREVWTADLGEFKGLNDARGHEAGNAALGKVGARIREAAVEAGLDPRDLFRSGGDEFSAVGTPEQVATFKRELEKRPYVEQDGMRVYIDGGSGKSTAEADAAAMAAKKARKGAAGIGPRASEGPRRVLRTGKTKADPRSAADSKAAARDATAGYLAARKDPANARDPQGRLLREIDPDYAKATHSEKMSAINEAWSEHLDRVKRGIKAGPEPDAQAAAPREAAGPRTLGRKVSIPSRDGKVEAQYEIVESSEVIASHDPGQDFDWNPAYPNRALQERDYKTRPREQQKVRGFLAKFDPAEVANTAPRATDGPPTLARDRSVLNGNGRAMTIQNLDPEGKARYRAYLKEHAAEFGLTPEQVDAMQDPMLVRSTGLDPQSKEAFDFARTGQEHTTQELRPIDYAARHVGMVKEGFWASLRSDEGESVGEAINLKGGDFRKALHSALPEAERARYFKDDLTLTDAGKELAENMVTLRAFSDPDDPESVRQAVEWIDALPPQYRNTLAASAVQVFDLGRNSWGRPQVDGLKDASWYWAKVMQGEEPSAWLKSAETAQTPVPPMSPLARAWMDFIYTNRASPKRFRSALKALATLENVNNAETAGLFKTQTEATDPLVRLVRVLDGWRPKSDEAVVIDERGGLLFGSPDSDPDAFKDRQRRIFGQKRVSKPLRSFALTPEEASVAREALANAARSAADREPVPELPTIRGGRLHRAPDAAEGSYGDEIGGNQEFSAALVDLRRAGDPRLPVIDGLLGKLGQAADHGYWASPGGEEVMRDAPPLASSERVSEAPHGFGLYPTPFDKAEAPSRGNGYAMDLPPLTYGPTGEWKGERVTAHALIKALERVVRGIPIRSGGMTPAERRRAAGYFKVGPEIIRLRHANDLPTAAHEMAHALEKVIYWNLLKDPHYLTKLGGNLGAEFDRLGKMLYGTTQPAAGYIREGFAEYLRGWMFGKPDVKKLAPTIERWFNGTFLKQHPEFAKELNKARELAQQFMAQGQRNVALAGIQGRAPEVNPGRVRRFLQRTKTKMLEAGDALAAFTDAANLRLPTALRDAQDPFALLTGLRLTHTARARYMADTGMIDVQGNVRGPSLKSAADMVIEHGRKKGWKKQQARDNFTIYLWARRAIERISRDRGNPGMSLGDAREIVKQLDSPEYQLAASRVYEWNSGLLAYAVSGGALSPLEASTIMAGSTSYVPLQRAIDSLADARGVLRAVQGGTPLKRFKGSGERIRDPFAVMIENAEKMARFTHERMVTNAVVRLSRVEGMGRWIDEIPRDKVPNKVKLDSVRRALTDAGADLTHADPDAIITFFSPAAHPDTGKPIIQHRDAAGAVKWYEVDPRIYEAIHGLDMSRLPAVLDWTLGAAARGLRLGTTGLRAAFSLGTNPVRDISTGYLQSTTRDNPLVYALEWGRSWANEARRTFGGKENPYSDLFERLGGNMAQPLGIDTRQTRRASKELFSGKGWKGRAVRIARSPIEHLRDLLQFPEAATRVAELRRVAAQVGYKPGGPITLDQSLAMLIAAKRSTVDFTAAGTWARSINQMVPFFNASIQGARTFARTMKEHPTRATLTGLTRTALALGLWNLHKDEDWYKDMGWREKFSFFWIPVGDELVGIPRVYDWDNVFATLPEAIADSLYRKDPRAALQAFSHLVETSPLQYLSPKGVLGANPLIGTTAELLSNKDYFTNKSIVPQNEERLPAEEQAAPYSSGVARFLGETLGWSPRKIDHTIRGLTGSAVHDTLGLVDAVAGSRLGMGSRAGEREFKDVPIVGQAFGRRGGKEGTGSVAVEDLFDKLAKAREREASKKNPELPEERELRLALEDAARAVKWLRTAQGSASTQAERQAIQREIRSIARRALVAVPGTRFQEEAKEAEFRGRAGASPPPPQRRILRPK